MDKVERLCLQYVVAASETVLAPEVISKQELILDQIMDLTDHQLNRDISREVILKNGITILLENHVVDSIPKDPS